MFNIFINDILFIDNVVLIYNLADYKCTSYFHSSISQIKIAKTVLERDIHKLLDWLNLTDDIIISNVNIDHQFIFINATTCGALRRAAHNHCVPLLSAASF